MRNKNDTVIKSYQLINTMFLSNEEFGILMRKILIDDDKERNRIENDIQDDDLIESFKEFKIQWNEDYEKIKRIPTVMAALASLKGQIKKSNDGYERERKKYEQRYKKKHGHFPEENEDMEIIEESKSTKEYKGWFIYDEETGNCNIKKEYMKEYEKQKDILSFSDDEFFNYILSYPETIEECRNGEIDIMEVVSRFESSRDGMPF